MFTIDKDQIVFNTLGVNNSTRRKSTDNGQQTYRPYRSP